MNTRFTMIFALFLCFSSHAQVTVIRAGRLIDPDSAELGEGYPQTFRKAVQAGVKMSFGTDLGICPYGSSPKQFALMLKYGMTPMQAIQAATSNAADLLGRSSEIGSIKPGKFADLVAVSGDPLTNISGWRTLSL